MVQAIHPSFAGVPELNSDFLSLFPHRFDYIYAAHPAPGQTPAWQTESRHPLTDRLINQGRFLYGVRFGKTSRYCLLDIDIGSPYHPDRDPFAIARITAALESIGFTRYLAITSSYSGGIHLYFPCGVSCPSWVLGSAVTIVLETAGFTVKPGLLEVFPNRKTYRIQGQPSLFAAHRLPLQVGSYLLNSDFAPVWSDRSKFIQQWHVCQQQNTVSAPALQRILKQHAQTHHYISGKAAKFLNDLNDEIEIGWTGSGQTNYLLGRIALRSYIFHHLLEGGAPLTGQALVDQIVQVARSLPGYPEWCNHQHEIEHRSTEWARCVENSHYFHYGINKNIHQIAALSEDQRSTCTQVDGTDRLDLTQDWNQVQLEKARDRIRQAIADLLNQNILPAQTTARFKALLTYGIGGGSLYRHKDLWHPGFLTLPKDDLEKHGKESEQSRSGFSGSGSSGSGSSGSSGFGSSGSEDLQSSSTFSSTPQPTTKLLDHSTNLFPTSGGNALLQLDLHRSRSENLADLGGNALLQLDCTDVLLALSLVQQIDPVEDWSIPGSIDGKREGLSSVGFPQVQVGGWLKGGVDLSQSEMPWEWKPLVGRSGCSTGRFDPIEFKPP